MVTRSRTLAPLLAAMPEPDLLKQSAVFFHLLSIGGRHDVHRAQKYFSRHGDFTQQPVHNGNYGNAKLFGEERLVTSHHAGPYQNLLVCVPSPHGLVITRLFRQGSNDSLEEVTCNATNQQAVQQMRPEAARPATSSGALAAQQTTLKGSFRLGGMYCSRWRHVHRRDAECWPPLHTLAKECALSVRSVIDHWKARRRKAG